MKHFSQKIEDVLTNRFQLNDETPQLQELVGLFLKWNQKHNLISKQDEKVIWERHVFDSLEIFNYIRKQSPVKILDMGSGMGFPLLPNKICLPDSEFHSVEPREKRLRILKQFKRELELTKVFFHLGKAEDFVSRETKEQFDVVTCRALGGLEEDWERARPFLKKGGKFITLKSFSDRDHFSKPAWESLPYNHLDKEQPYYLVVRNK